MFCDTCSYRKRLLISLFILIIIGVVWLTTSNRPYAYTRSYSSSSNRNFATANFAHLKKDSRDYSFMAFLNIHRDNKVTNCGGTLIGKRHILTAAHCIQGASSIWISLGTDDIQIEEKPALRLESESFIVHENFDNDTYNNDIALIYLDQDVPIDENVNAISLVPSSNVTKDNKTPFVVLGWGLVDPPSGLNDKLLAKNVSIVDNIFCFLTFESQDDVHQDSKICAYGKSGPCQGDSGGPLVAENIQIGIVSLGDNGCNASAPTLYTKVEYFWPWIKNKTEKFNTLL